MSAKKRKQNKRFTKKRSPQELKARRARIRNVLLSILVILAIGAALVFLFMRDSEEISLSENAVGSLVTRVQMVLSNATNSVKQFTERWHNYGKLEDDYEELSLKYQQVSLELSAAKEAIIENERLRDDLNAKDRYESLDPIYAKVIARSPGQWFETFSINRGKLDGITVGMAVVNGDGLIGRVIEAGNNYAKVICIVDARSSVACMVQSTRDNGIMRGEIAQTSERAECYVYYLPGLNNVMPGDAVITSGTDSLYPKGLHIGTITAVSMDAGSEGSYAVVSPSVDFRHIEEVFVLRTVIEKDIDEALPSVANTSKPNTGTTPAPNANTTPTPSPTPAEEQWSYPSQGPSVQLETLPEDEWVRSSSST